MRVPIEVVNQKLKDLGLVTESGKAISFTKFKSIADIHEYGYGKRKVFIIFVLNSRENIFGFYPPTCTRVEMLKISYEYLLDTIGSEIKQEFLDGNIQWGNCGIPLAYGDLRAMIPF
jgi:hypothetical protein